MCRRGYLSRFGRDEQVKGHHGALPRHITAYAEGREIAESLIESFQQLGTPVNGGRVGSLTGDC